MIVGEGEVLVGVHGDQREVEEGREVRDGSVRGGGEVHAADTKRRDGEQRRTRVVDDVHGGGSDGGHESEDEEDEDGPETAAAADSPAARSSLVVVVAAVRLWTVNRAVSRNVDLRFLVSCSVTVNRRRRW